MITSTNELFESINKQVAQLAEAQGWAYHHDVLRFLDDMLPDPTMIGDKDYMDEWRQNYMRR